MSDLQIAGVAALVLWVGILTLELMRLSGRLGRLDAIVAGTLKALGFPKISGSGGDNRT